MELKLDMDLGDFGKINVSWNESRNGFCVHHLSAGDGSGWTSNSHSDFFPAASAAFSTAFHLWLKGTVE